MTTQIKTLFIALALIASVHQAAAQGVRFFRISGPSESGIIAFQTDGTLVWTNAQADTNYVVQTVAALPGGTNWVDYVQLPITQSVNTNQIISFNSPAGMAFIPAGLFAMGDALDSESDAIPTNIYVSAFYMDVNLVSYSQWTNVYAYATNHGYNFVNVGGSKNSITNQPVQSVDWFSCLKWSNARSQQAGLAPVYYTDYGLTKLYTNGEPTMFL